ncbi:SDR family NAD(P)-dependent oxidoreductase [Herbiconiux ginsengi]|uniref:3alpha(Or 20beta)-hydroxysteroid dehydrogenase n=1 Tax=Herbiconiux ginsengi TaxID=381665 RepID=A0A1H3LPR5_9MICO|nr:SDR family NAD(P)-dependent oxidoreductase [Herbiconiux ginsengi]SDY65968.1 3alpha(or 20beta)-hydroxysteroid dehydrogenase [Herbiconiux ginsengi]
MVASQFEGRVALVSGGARGIGEAHVRALIGAGARVVIGDVAAEPGERLAREFGADRARFTRLDVQDAESWESAVAVAEEFGQPVSVLVNNAGIARPHLIENHPLDDWDLTLAVNLTGSFLGIRSVIEPMKRYGGGAIVNTSSMTTHQHPVAMASYTASKSGVTSLTRVASMELAPYGIRVNALHPGMIATDMTADADEAETIARVPLRRFGTPEDVAGTMLFIVRDAHYATGSDFFIDGGIIAGRVPGSGD